MARSKFLAFACITLALGLAQLIFLSPQLGEAAVERQRANATSAASAASARLGERRAQLLGGIVALVNSPAGAGLTKIAKGEAPSPAKLTSLRTALAESVPSSVRSGLVVAWVGESKTLYARGEAEPTSEPELGELAKGFQAPPEGMVTELFGVDHILFTLPAAVGADGKPSVTLWVGAPVWDAGSLESHARELNTLALAVLREGKVVASVGPEAAALAPSSTSLPAGDASVVLRGSAKKAGPLALPMFSGPGAASGGSAAKVVGARSPLLGSPYAVAVFVSAAPEMVALAGFQLGSLGLWFLAFAIALVFAYLAHREESEGPAMRAPSMAVPGRPSAPVRSAEARPATPAVPANVPAARSAPEARSGSLPSLTDAPPTPEANPDDFQFSSGSAPRSSGGMHDLSAPPVAELSAPPVHSLPDDVEEDDSAEATRAVMIPRELLRAAQGGGVSAAAAAPGGLSEDEQHFQDVFKEFVATREKCGEPQDGLTYEKFAVKLRKSHEQLVQKHQCKTVRFQVYVKDGKAALKATPLRQ